MNTLYKPIIIGIALISSSYSYAESMTIEFSADAVVSIPQQPVNQKRLFVGKNAVRSETIINGHNIVEIVYPDEGRAVLINQPIKAYQERTFNKQNENINTSNPCGQISHSECKKLGNETINGLKTEKWQITSNKHGNELRTLHWIDVKRKLAIREIFPDGTVAELKMVKREKMDGRNTEKWERSLSRPDGTTSKSYQWYDTGLGIAIKEELPGGYIRELKNITISSQPDKLFSVPVDFKKINYQQDSMHPEYFSR